MLFKEDNIILYNRINYASHKRKYRAIFRDCELEKHGVTPSANSKGGTLSLFLFLIAQAHVRTDVAKLPPPSNCGKSA